MTPEQYERLTELFYAALEIAPNERAAFLEQVCDGDADLRQHSESALFLCLWPRSSRRASTRPSRDGGRSLRGWHNDGTRRCLWTRIHRKLNGGSDHGTIRI